MREQKPQTVIIKLQIGLVFALFFKKILFKLTKVLLRFAIFTVLGQHYCSIGRVTYMSRHIISWVELKNTILRERTGHWISISPKIYFICIFEES